jgi:hypothetical protein
VVVPAMVSVPREALPVRPERVVPCILRAARPAEARPQARVPASASAPEDPVDDPVSASVPVVPTQGQDSCRLQAKRRVRSVPRRARAVAASSIRRLKKAR